MKPIEFKLTLYKTTGEVLVLEKSYYNKTGMLASFRHYSRKAKFTIVEDAWAVYEDGSTELVLDKEVA